VSQPRIYTRDGDDGTTGLLYGGRVRKDAPAPRAYGAVDEAQAAMGMARVEAEPGGELDRLLIRLERDLYVCGAELATAPENHHKLTPGATAVTAEMVTALEHDIDMLKERFEMPSDFVIPGANRVSAALELARTIVRRAERDSLVVAVDGSHAVAYLNRLSDLLWAMARWQEADDPTLLAKEIS
jgi:cob(I)alamin adenosyltransferase